MSTNSIGRVLSCSPEVIVVVIESLPVFEDNKQVLQVGRYLKISQGNNDFTIATIRNVKGVLGHDSSGEPKWHFHIDCQAVGTLIDGDIFERTSMLLPVPTELAYVADKVTLDKLFAQDADYNFPLGQLSINKSTSLHIDGNKFFSKHIAIVGSTGAGKSCTVARILQDVVGIDDEKNVNIDGQNNSHVVIFDIHDEYTAAFSLEDEQKFSLNRLDVDTLQLPYWLMNSEELESMFIESNEQNSHNQVSQFKQAVILNKEKHNSNIEEMTYDTPVYFSIQEVYQYIENMNREVIGRLPGENKPKLEDGTLVDRREDYYFQRQCIFVQPSTSKAEKATNGPFNGEFNRFVSRLESKLSDKRLRFLLHPKNTEGENFTTEDFDVIMQQFLGYLNKANITIVDLSGVPFEVLSITVSLVSRLIFDFCFHYSKLRHKERALNNVPVMIVCEEAHNYIPCLLYTSDAADE